MSVGATLLEEKSCCGTSPAMENRPPEPASPSTRLHVGLPSVPDEESFLRCVEEVLASRRLTNDGPTVRLFESRIASFLGTKHALAVCNATLGLQIAAKALGLRGEVIMPSFTFVATAHAFEWIGLEPVFVDIDPKTHNIDPAKITDAVTGRTSAIVGVHLWGAPCDTDAIETTARQRGLRVIYDASHAFGCFRGGTMVGNFGDCEVFSFHATKFVHSFEGGVITTNDDDLAAKIRLMRNFGFAGHDLVVSAGINAKMPEVCAAMGLCNLDSMHGFVETNRRNYDRYRQLLHNLPGISLLAYDPEQQGNHQYVVVEVDAARCRLTRDELVRALHAEDIMARRYFWPGCHRMEPYRTLQPDAWKRLPHTEHVAAQVIALPAGPAVSLDAVARVCDVLARTVRS